jgi:hypothetical protein
VHKIYLTLLFSIALLSGYAQQDTAAIQTDRPDQSESAQLVKPGKYQFELGAFYNPFRNGEPTALIGAALLRVGLLKRLELGFLIEEGRNRDYFIEETTQGLYPLALRTKLSLFENKKSGTNLALVTYLKLPGTARSSEQNAYWSPAFILALDQELSDKWMIEVNGGYKQNAFDPEWAWTATTSLKYDITPKLEFFTEYFAHYANEQEPVHNIDAGAAYKITKNIQIDAAAGGSIKSEVPNYFITGGLSFRFPKRPAASK